MKRTFIKKIDDYNNVVLQKASNYWIKNIDKIISSENSNANLKNILHKNDNKISEENTSNNKNISFVNNQNINESTDFSNKNEEIILYNKDYKKGQERMKSTPTSYIDKRNWSEEEDRILMSYIELYNSKNWKKISEILITKSSQQCVYRYHKLINQNKEVKWNRAEDIKLMELIETNGNEWDLFAKFLDKPVDAIKHRYLKKLDPHLK